LAAGGGDRSSPGNEEAMIFFRIARNEWRSLKSDSVVWLLLISLAVSVSYAIFNGRQIQRRQKEANEEFVEVEAAAVERYHRLNEETWRKIDAGEITEIPEWSNREFLTPLFSYWDFQLQKSATRPFSPLAFLDLGQSDIYPSAYKPYDPGQFYRETTPSAPQAGNPLSLMIGGFDPAFVVIYLLPLFIIGLSFNLLSSEKESGVLGLLLSHPVSLHTVLWAKIVARATLVFVPTLILITGGMLALDVNWNEEASVTKLILWLAAVLAYQTFWFGLAILVNSFGRSSSANALILAVCWLGFALLIPSACGLVARTVYPVPSPAVLREAKRDAIMDVGADLWSQGVKELDDENSRTSKLVARFLEENSDLKIIDPPSPGQKFSFTFINDVRNSSPVWRRRTHAQRFHLVYEARAAEIEEIIKPAQDRFDYQYSKQHELFNRLRVMSPAMLCQLALTRLSGSSAEQHDRFMAQVDRNHREWRHFFLKKTLSGDLLRPDDYAKFPYFHYEIEPLSSILAWIKLPLMEIGVLTVIVAAVGLIKFKTYAVIS
jgi:ABC-2 type transport system permease protein